MLPADTFDKVVIIVKAFIYMVVLAALAAALEFSGTVDWTGLGVFGPALGLAIGTGLAAALAYAKKELSGYGTKQNPQIPKEN